MLSGRSLISFDFPSEFDQIPTKHTIQVPHWTMEKSHCNSIPLPSPFSILIPGNPCQWIGFLGHRNWKPSIFASNSCWWRSGWIIIFPWIKINYGQKWAWFPSIIPMIPGYSMVPVETLRSSPGPPCSPAALADWPCRSRLGPGGVMSWFSKV